MKRRRGGGLKKTPRVGGKGRLSSKKWEGY